MNTFNKEMKELLIERMEIRLKQGRAAPIYQLGTDGSYYTPEEILEEAKKGTEVGEEFLWAEKKLMDELKKRM